MGNLLRTILELFANWSKELRRLRSITVPRLGIPERDTLEGVLRYIERKYYLTGIAVADERGIVGSTYDDAEHDLALVDMVLDSGYHFVSVKGEEWLSAYTRKGITLMARSLHQLDLVDMVVMLRDIRRLLRWHDL